MYFRKLVLLSLLLAGIGSCKKNDNNVLVSEVDRDFATRASYANLNEQEAGKLAAANGLRDSVRIFGQLMLTDHLMAQQTLDSIALLLNITTPKTPDTAHVAIIQRLSTMSGHSFDTAYLHLQLTDHQAALHLLQNEIANGTNVKFKAYATDKLPVLQKHYEMALSLSKTQ